MTYAHNDFYMTYATIKVRHVITYFHLSSYLIFICSCQQYFQWYMVSCMLVVFSLYQVSRQHFFLTHLSWSIGCGSFSSSIQAERSYGSVKEVACYAGIYKHHVIMRHQLSLRFRKSIFVKLHFFLFWSYTTKWEELMEINNTVMMMFNLVYK